MFQVGSRKGRKLKAIYFPCQLMVATDNGVNLALAVRAVVVECTNEPEIAIVQNRQQGVLTVPLWAQQLKKSHATLINVLVR